MGIWICSVKEQYYSAQELVDIVKHYRDIEVPLDCVVQDWNTWDPGNWGEKLVDKIRYGNLKEAMDEIHTMNAHSMVFRMAEYECRWQKTIQNF